MPDPQGASLAPEPDFRLVSLIASSRSVARRLGALTAVSVSALAGLSVGLAFGAREAVVASAVSACATVFVANRRVRRAEPTGRPVTMSIVPWGVIVEEGVQTRVLRWGAIAGIDVDTVFGRDQATDVTRHSVVVVDTGAERLIGRTFGEAPLDRLLAHREAYAREADHVAAIDIDGGSAAGEPWEPQVERLLLASRELVSGASGRLSGDIVGYRGPRASLASEEVAVRLRAVLRDRTDRACDPRPLCAILAAELDLESLAPEVAQLVSSPHPLTAAVARAAGVALGLPKSRLGVLEEVAPFLPDGEVEALAAWSAVRSASRPDLTSR